MSSPENPGRFKVEFGAEREVIHHPQDPAIASPRELNILDRSDFSIDAVYGDVEGQQHPPHRMAELVGERLVPRRHDDRQ